MASKCTAGQVFLWVGIILGILEYLFYIIWAASTDFAGSGSATTSAVFLITQPLWSFFIWLLYMGQHQHNDIREGGERCKKLLYAPLFTLAMQSKLLASHDGFHEVFCNRFDVSEIKFNLMTVENLYRVQTVLEFILLTLPMMIIVSSYSNSNEWTAMGQLAIFFASLMFAKNLTIFTIFIIRKFVDGTDDPPMRPRTAKQKFSRVEMEAFNHIQSYLIEPHDDGVDPDGNTTVH